MSQGTPSSSDVIDANVLAIVDLEEPVAVSECDLCFIGPQAT